MTVNEMGEWTIRLRVLISLMERGAERLSQWIGRNRNGSTCVPVEVSLS